MNKSEQNIIDKANSYFKIKVSNAIEAQQSNADALDILKACNHFGLTEFNYKIRKNSLHGRHTDVVFGCDGKNNYYSEHIEIVGSISKTSVTQVEKRVLKAIELAESIAGLRIELTQRETSNEV